MEKLVLRPYFARVLIPNLFGLLLSIVIILLLFLGLIVIKNEIQIIYFLSFGLILIGGYFFYLIYILGILKSMRYRVDDKSIKEDYLFFTQGKKVIPFSEVTDVGFNKTWFLDKIFGTGSLQISTSGTGGYDFVIKYIKDTDTVYNLLNSKLKLSKSIELNNNGTETESSQSSIKLEDRIQPEAWIATLITSSVGLVLWIVYFGWIFGLIISIIQATITYMAYRRMYYDFYTDKVEYYDGFLNKNKKTLSFNRVTNIIENRSLIDRIFGVSKIFVETAGSSAPEIKITYVKNGDEIVNNLKHLLKEHGKD